MSSMFGETVRLSLFGQSHGEMIGCVLDGLPAGEAVDEEALRAFLRRRAPGGAYATPRKEADIPRVVSGLYEGKTCGAPLCVLIENTDTRSRDYEALRDLPRPGHADFPAQVRHRGFQDVRGGGHFSARVTAALCAAGGIILQILARKGIAVGAHLLSVGDVLDDALDPLNPSVEDLRKAQSGFPTISQTAEARMKALIDEVRGDKDSVGGVVECAVLGLPVGLGEPMFGGIENTVAQAVFAIPAVKGIEFGEGFTAAAMRGSQHNDAYRWQDGEPKPQSNHAGGILGGLTDALPQQTVSLSGKRDAVLEISGRHDPCVAVRAIPVVEAAAALAVAQFVF